VSPMVVPLLSLWCAPNLPAMNIVVQCLSYLRRSNRRPILITMSTATEVSIPTPRVADETLDDLPLCSFNADPVPDMDDHTLACGDCFAYYRMEN
jgi:hypothetical protein